MALGCVRASSISFAFLYPLGCGNTFESKKNNKKLKLSSATIAIASLVTFLVSGFSGENAKVPVFALVIFPLGRLK